MVSEREERLGCVATRVLQISSELGAGFGAMAVVLTVTRAKDLVCYTENLTFLRQDVVAIREFHIAVALLEGRHELLSELVPSQRPGKSATTCSLFAVETFCILSHPPMMMNQSAGPTKVGQRSPLRPLLQVWLF